MKSQKTPLLLKHLAEKGVSTSSEIQAAIEVSQPTASRLISALPGQILALGQGRSVRYGLAKQIGTASAQQAIWSIDENGKSHQVGLLSFVAPQEVHIASEGLDELVRGELPWYLSPLRAQGFLGRLHAKAHAEYGLPPNPDSWGIEAQLISALHLHDAPGALILGESAIEGDRKTIPSKGEGYIQALDEHSSDVAKTLPGGSSAGGEQPKFLAINDDLEHLIVKFSPPRGTPFGERWNDLLMAEVLCNEVLSRHGFEVANCEIVHGSKRTYLVSKRFDRVGALGRRHVVSIGAAHAAFAPGNFNSWAESAQALARQGRLLQQDAQLAGRLMQFGRLVGNTDMHSGNLGLYVAGASLAEIAKGKFRLAPVYDMLPMRWKPDPMMGMIDYGPFVPNDQYADDATRAAAHEFWIKLSEQDAVSTAMREVAAEMAERMSPADRNADRERGG